MSDQIGRDNQKSVESTLNSSTQLLLDTEVFTGIGEMNDYRDVMIDLYTDQDGNLDLQTSVDNENWVTDTSASFRYIANTNVQRVFNKGQKYFRVVFTNNSGSNQTLLRLFTYYGIFHTQKANAISSTSHNSRDAATLAAGATFQGVGEDVSMYSRVGVAITSDNATDGTLTMEVSHDGINWGGPTRTWSDTRFGQPHMWEIVEKYFRIKYVNGSTEATNLAIQTHYSTNGSILLGHQLDETLLNETEAIVTRSIVGGQDENGTYRNVNVTSDGALKLASGQAISSDNTKVVAAADAQPASPWIGTWELTRDLGVARVLIVLAATDATEDGLGGTFTFEFGEDGSTADISESFTITDFQTVRDFNLLNAGKYFRVKFEPDRALSSDTVAITTTLRKQDDGAFVRIANQQIEKGNAAMPQSFAYLKGFKPDGRSADVLMNPEGQLIFSEYNIEVARGNIAGAASVLVASRNAGVGTTEQVIWNGGTAYNFLTAAATVRIKAGGNTNDTAAGSGAREVTVVGLDSTGALISETIATNGSSASTATSASFRRVNDFYVSQAGTYATGALGTGSNTGAISIETSAGTLLGTMLANTGSGTVGVYTVPLNKKGYFQRIRVTPEGNKNVTFRLWTRANFDDTSAPLAPKELRAEWALIGEESGFELTHPFELAGKTDVWVSANTGTGTSAASCAFEIEIIDD